MRTSTISKFKEMENLLVFCVNQDRHHIDALVAQGMANRDGIRVLQEHQASQLKPALYLWKDELGKPGVQRMLEHRNGTDTSERIHARECAVEPVDLPTARAFYDTWHLQGACTHLACTLALTRAGEPVAMMSFGNPKACRGLEVPWLLQRYACVGRVPGAASRLLAAFRRENRGAIVSYSDNRYSPTGGLYRILGFNLHAENIPDYRYWRDGRWYAKNTKQRKHLIAELGGCTPEDTEYTMATRAGYKRCYDCGKKTWVLDT
jgi:hypothetical protein